MTGQLVLEIKEELLKEDKYFYGPLEVLRIYKKRHLNEEVPTIDFIKRICRVNSLTKKYSKRQKGCSSYQHYPAYAIANLSDSISELDFVGQKYINGQTEPVNFISYNSLKPFKFREFEMITSQTSNNAVNYLGKLWERLPSPGVLKVDNDAAFIGSASGKRSLSKFVIFLLNWNVKPLFICPRSPWNNGSIEGGNNVFGTKFWNRHSFSPEKEIKSKLKVFNRSYIEYLESPNTGVANNSLRKANQIYFIRKVRENNGAGSIDVLNECIHLPESYINHYVFVEWVLDQQVLKIKHENDCKLNLVKELEFKINSRLGWSRSSAP